jgi:NADPH:quinone reductase-like Zn-dependent oxidoreductase
MIVMNMAATYTVLTATFWLTRLVMRPLPTVGNVTTSAFLPLRPGPVSTEPGSGQSGTNGAGSYDEPVKAAAFSQYGPAEVLQYTDVADPVTGPQDVLVRVGACAVNHSDIDSRAGTARWPFTMPWVLGAEFTGTVVGTGDEVTSVSAGDQVTAMLQYSCGKCERCHRWRPDLCANFEIFGTTRWGGYGELVSVPAAAVVPLRPGDDPLAMAGGQCVISTAWHMVNRLANVHPGDLVLVPSGSGGVASVLVQCAKLAGLTVIATAGSAAKAERVAALGVDAVVVREGSTGQQREALQRAAGGRPFDAVLDTVGGEELFGMHLSLLRPDGTLVTCGAHAGEVVPLDIVPLFQNGWRIIGFRTAPPDELMGALELIRTGQVTVPIAATYPLSDAAEAHRFLERRQHVGKVLLVSS